MITLYSQGKGQNVSYPVKASTAYAKGDLLALDAAGSVVPVTNFAAAQEVVGICNEDIASADAAAKGNTLVFVPRERYLQFVADTEGSTDGTFGVQYGLSAASTVDLDLDEVTDADAHYVRFISSLEYDATNDIGKAIVQIRFGGQY